MALIGKTAKSFISNLNLAVAEPERSDSLEQELARHQIKLLRYCVVTVELYPLQDQIRPSGFEDESKLLY